MPINLITIRLDSRISFEKRLFDLYTRQPRSRRQEWLRHVLKEGIKHMKPDILPAEPDVGDDIPSMASK